LRTIVPWNFHSLELSYPRVKVTWNFRRLTLIIIIIIYDLNATLRPMLASEFDCLLADGGNEQ